MYDTYLLTYLLIFQATPNSPTYPHELKNISTLYHRPFPVIKRRFYLHLLVIHSILYSHSHFKCVCCC